MPTGATQSQISYASVTAPLNFISREMQEVPFYNRKPPPGQPDTNIVMETVPTEIVDLNSLLAEDREGFTVETAGFQIVPHESKFGIEGFEDDAKIKAEYYPEVESLLKQVTGASRIIFFDYTLRRRKHDAPEDFNPRNRGPGLVVHADQTPKSAREKLFSNAGNDAGRFSKGRYEIINVWRPLNLVQDAPLAYCDFRTADVQHDFVSTALFGDPNIPDGETYSIRSNPAQKWYFLRDQTPADVVLLKCYDSEPWADRALATPHSAFVDPTVPDRVPARQSIEVRALVCYEVA